MTSDCSLSHRTQLATDCQSTARHFISLGCSIVPTYANKRPHSVGLADGSWTEYQTIAPTDEAMAQWFGQEGVQSFGLICKGEIVLIDIDRKEFETEGKFNEGGFNTVVSDLRAATKGAYWERTQSGGYHIILRMHNHPLGCRHIATAANPKQRIGELRSTNGYTLIAPSVGYVAETSLDFTLTVDSIANLGLVFTADRRKDETAIAPTASSVSTIATTTLLTIKGTSIRDNVSDAVRALLDSPQQIRKGNRSDSFYKVATEVLGWENEFTAQKVKPTDPVELMLLDYATAIGYGNSEAKHQISEVRKKQHQFKPSIALHSQITGHELFIETTAADAIANDIRSRLLFDETTQSFWKYCETGIWVQLSDLALAAFVKPIMQKPPNGYKAADVVSVRAIKNVVECLKLNVFGSLTMPKGLLCFRNGVLNIATKEFLPHSADFHFTSQIDRDYNPKDDSFPNLNKWFEWCSGGDNDLKLSMFCAIRAVLLSRSDLQTIIHCVGSGRNGKGTYSRIVTDLIGTNNVYSTTVKRIAENRFDSANYVGKTLLICPDENPYSGGIGTIKSISGGDIISAERKGKDAFQFTFGGVLMINANKPVFSGENSTALRKRLMILPFLQTIADDERREINFGNELSAFTNYLLNQIDDVVMERHCKGVAISQTAKTYRDSYLERSNSMDSWAKEVLIPDHTAEVLIGKKTTPNSLYQSYCEYCEGGGYSPKSLNNFADDLMDMLKHQYAWAVSKSEQRRGKTQSTKGSKGKFIDGVRLRSPADDIGEADKVVADVQEGEDMPF
jgi:P4 family phage/plasmid primase-like protien